MVRSGNMLQIKSLQHLLWTCWDFPLSPPAPVKFNPHLCHIYLRTSTFCLGVTHDTAFRIFPLRLCQHPELHVCPFDNVYQMWEIFFFLLHRWWVPIYLQMSKKWCKHEGNGKYIQFRVVLNENEETFSSVLAVLCVCRVLHLIGSLWHCNYFLFQTLCLFCICWCAWDQCRFMHCLPSFSSLSDGLKN